MSKKLNRLLWAIMFFLVFISCYGQNSLNIINLYNGVIIDVDIPTKDSIILVENNQGSTIIFNKESLKYQGIRYSKGSLRIKKQVKWKGKSLIYDVNSIRLFDKNGNLLYNDDSISSQLYCLDINDSFILISSESNFKLINYISGSSKTISNLTKNDWFAKLLNNNTILYVDLKGNLICQNIYQEKQLVLNKITAPPDELKYFKKNSKEFILYSQNFTYCYKNNKVIKIIFNSDQYLSKLLVTSNFEYFYDSSSVSIITKEIRTQKKHTLKISKLMQNQNHNYDLDSFTTEYSNIINFNMILSKPNKWTLSDDSKNLVGFTINGKVLIFKFD